VLNIFEHAYFSFGLLRWSIRELYWNDKTKDGWIVWVTTLEHKRALLVKTPET